LRIDIVDRRFLLANGMHLARYEILLRVTNGQEEEKEG